MKLLRLLILVLIVPGLGCSSAGLFSPTPTPLPGWRIPVSELFVDVDVFPEGWAHMRDLPPEVETDPTINHVTRIWWDKAQGKGRAEQSFWRAYTVDDAKEKYNYLTENGFNPTETQPADFFVPYQPPSEITFRSQAADEHYLACGWGIGSFCEIAVRYRNYVAYMRINLKGRNQGYDNDTGLTYAEIEVVLAVMDAKFVEFFARLPAPTP